jgi:hypothetical protein
MAPVQDKNQIFCDEAIGIYVGNINRFRLTKTSHNTLQKEI